MKINEMAVNKKNHIIYLKLYIYKVKKVINGGGSLLKAWFYWGKVLKT